MVSCRRFRLSLAAKAQTADRNGCSLMIGGEAHGKEACVIEVVDVSDVAGWIASAITGGLRDYGTTLFQAGVWA